MYHRVDVVMPRSSLGRALSVTPDQLEAQLRYLQAHHLRGVSVSEFYDRMKRGQSTADLAVITFDDGYADQFQYAVPLLQRFGDHATFYIVTGMLGRPNHMTWRNVRALAGEGMDVGAHGVMHVDLASLTPAQQAFQIDGSIAALQRNANLGVVSYAYPSGRFNHTTEEILEHTAVRLAFTTDPVYTRGHRDQFDLTRVRVKGGWSLADFISALSYAEAHRPAVAPYDSVKSVSGIEVGKPKFE
ncbi:MAG: polysaccharide deacetylase family protein [Candidatus Eremiobacteraeota bacterium]|nr:polysaccharide deacetylase family protein [Candidatus Eremiobacteraeota bacterium]